MTLWDVCFDYTIIPLGINNAPVTFLQLLNSVFHDILNECLAIYLDNLLVYSSKEEEYERGLR